jgi:hypothetical protein
LDIFRVADRQKEPPAREVRRERIPRSSRERLRRNDAIAYTPTEHGELENESAAFLSDVKDVGSRRFEDLLARGHAVKEDVSVQAEL